MNYLYKQKDKNYLLFPMLSVTLGLLFVRDYIGVWVPAIVFLGLSFIMATFGNEKEIISFCICLIPMLNAFQTKYALVICMGMYYLRFSRSTKLNKLVLPIIMLFIWELIHGLLGAFSPVEIIRLFVEFAFCAFLMSVSYDDIDFNLMARALAITTVVVCFIILLSQLKQTGYNVSVLFSGIFRFGSGVDEDVLSVGFNPNLLSFICLTSIECLCFLPFKSEQTIFDYVMIVLLIMFGLLTMSKKFIIAGLLFAFLFLMSQNNSSKKIKYFALMCALAVVVYFVLERAFPTVIDMIIARFQSDDITTGRTDIMAFYNDQLVSDGKLLLFGVGYYGYKATLDLMFPGVNIPHNGIQELLVMWGLPGLILFVVLLSNMIREAKTCNPGLRFVNFVPLIVLLVFCQAAQMVSSTVIVMLIAVSYICLCENVQKNRYEETF